MKRLALFLAVVWAISLCGIAAAQDRGWATSIAWSPDGETIAIGSSAGIWFFDNEFNELGRVPVKLNNLKPWYEGDSPRSLDWHAAGELLAVGFPMSMSGPPQIIDVSKREVINEIDPPWPWSHILWHPEDNRIIAGLYGGETYIWDALTGEKLFYFEESAERDDFEVPPEYALPTSLTTGVCWITESIVGIVTARGVYVVDVEINRMLQWFDIGWHQDTADCNSDYKAITANGWLIDLKTGAHTRIFKRVTSDFDLEGAISPLTYLDAARSPDGSQIASITEGCHINVYDGHNGALLAEMLGGIYLSRVAFPFFQDSIAWHPDSSRFAVVGQFGSISVWDAETYELLRRFDGFESSYTATHWMLFENLSEEERNLIDAGRMQCEFGNT